MLRPILNTEKQGLFMQAEQARHQDQIMGARTWKNKGCKKDREQPNRKSREA